ncbi:hypothetical protein [Flectobacillus roseus]|jgi:hypothetical protein|nr:hypothetical protein [Flectobacillus roseus]MDI9870273.1 hypothetical protein [Flectobacillus roseus]
MKFRLLLVSSILAFSTSLFAQNMTDGIFMAKNNFCGGIGYTHDTWNKYWEGTLFRENKNLGNVNTQTITAMGNYGISDRFNVLFMLPYVKTEATKGTLKGMSGVQDLTLALKYRLAQIKNLSVIGSVGGSLPTNNYVADFLPLAIGMQSKTVFARGILYYTLPHELALTAQGAYIHRSNVRVDREMYFSDQAYFTNEMMMPDVVNLGAKFGHYSYRWQLEATYEQNIVNGDIDIRRNDMPGLCAKMDLTRIGLVAAYRIPQLKDLQIMGTIGQVVAGRNVGKSTTFSISILQYIDLRKNKGGGGIPTGPICRPGDVNHMGNMSTDEHKDGHK